MSKKKPLDFMGIIAAGAAVVAIIGGAASALAFFAKDAELVEARCEYRNGLLLAGANTKLLEAEQSIFNARVTRERAERDRPLSEQFVIIDQIIATKESERDVLIAEISQLTKLSAGRECKS